MRALGGGRAQLVGGPHHMRLELQQLIAMLAAGGDEMMVQRGGRVSGASPSEINQLPTRKVIVKPAAGEGAAEEDERITCMVCLAEKDVGDNLRTLPCMHDFHCECIDTWLKTNRTCPICKHDITDFGDESAGMEEAAAAE